jgi:hypothetical protein
MDGVADILFSMQKRGVKLWIEAGSLLYKAPPGVLTAEEIAGLRSRKVEIIKYLERSQPAFRTEPSMGPRLTSDQVPLTFQQQWLWSFIPRSPGGTLNMGYALRLSGALNVEFLKKSLDVIIQRNESLRTRIVVTDGIPQQHVDQACECTLDICCLTGISKEESERLASTRVDAFVQEPIDYVAGPLFKTKLLKLSDLDHVFIVTMDHMISDGHSVRVLLRDIRTLYIQCALGVSLSTPGKSLQYADYAAWQQKTCDYWLETHSDYWKRRLDGAKPIRFPVDQGISEVRPGSATSTRIKLGATLTSKFRHRMVREQTTVPMGLLAAFVALVARWCSANDFVVAFNAMGRHVPELADTIGYFAHILHLRMELTEKDTLRDTLTRVVKEYRTACEHDDFGRIVASMPQFVRNARFQCEPPFIRELEVEGFENDIKVEQFPMHRKEAAAPDDEIARNDESETGVGIMFSETAEDIVGEISYRADHLREDTMERFGQDLRLLCQTFADNPWSPALKVSGQ